MKTHPADIQITKNTAAKEHKKEKKIKIMIAMQCKMDHKSKPNHKLQENHGKMLVPYTNTG